MSKFVKIAGIALVLVAVLAVIGATTILAQGPSGSNGWMHPGQMNQGQNQPGSGQHLMMVDQADMHAAIADALSMSVADFEAALAAGQTPYDLAVARGVDFADVLAAMDAVHAAALQDAVAAGLITQEQADWMLSRRGGMNGQGYQGGQGGMHGGMGQQGGHGGICPYQ